MATEHNKKELQELRVDIERHKKMFEELEESRQVIKTCNLNIKMCVVL